MYFFTSDEHFGHKKVIEYCNRPYSSVEEMDEALIKNHNEVVKNCDTVVHVGDFSLVNNQEKVNSLYVSRLNGYHIFLNGSHDHWLKRKQPYSIFEKKFDDIYIAACHYAMHTWPRSHYGSYHLFGHSHGNLELSGYRYDIGVDNNHYYPVSLEQIKEIMRNKEK